MGLGESIIQGLSEAIEFEKGNLKVRRQVVKTIAVPTYKAAKK